MPRKKTAKRAGKRPVAGKATASPMQKMEKDFQQSIVKVVGQLATDAKRAKLQVAKIQATHKKAQAKAAKSEARVKAAQKNKQTSSGKKQLKIAMKQHAAATKLLSAVAKQLNNAEKALENAEHTQAKLVALRKYINQFSQVWAKEATKLKKTKKVKASTKAKPRKKIKRVEPQQNFGTSDEQSSHSSDDYVSSENTATEETNDFTS